MYFRNPRQAFAKCIEMFRRGSALEPWQNHHERQEVGHCPQSPLRCFAEHRLALAEMMVGLTLISASETKQLALRIWQPAFRSDTPKPVRQLPVMLPGML